MGNATKVIGIAAPSSGFDSEIFKESVDFIESLGFKALYGGDIFDRAGYLAGSDERRADELNALLSRDEVDIVMCARGGYGSSRIIELLNLELIKGSGKLFIGASDVCSVLYYLENRTDLQLFFGPFVTEMRKGMDKESLEIFIRMIREGDFEQSVTGLTTLLPGKAEAHVTGGTLSIIQASLKTKYEIETDGKILFIEDVSEPLYKIDRMLTHLKNAGKFDGINGVMAGSFNGMDAEKACLHRLLIDTFGAYNVPVVSGFPAGHGVKKFLIPFKRKVLLNADSGTVKYV